MKTKYLLLALLLIGFLLRVVALGQRPAGFTWDEAALGYNAYSLLKTARDEYGQLVPVIFKSFGDFKPGLYIYFTVPAVKLFGLNEFATRVPSAVFGTLLLAVIYVLARILFPKNLQVGTWSLALAAINPWLLQFSRGAWEANLNLLLITLAVTLFVFYLNRKPQIFHLSFVFFGLTFWTYQSAKLFSPLLILVLLILFRTSFSIKKFILPLALCFIFIIPVILNFSSQSGRLKVFSVFSYTRRSEDVAEILRQDNAPVKNVVYYLFHSELLDQGRGVLQRYLSHLSPRFLFSQGDWTSLRHSVYKQGYFYLIDIVPLVIGLLVFLSGLKANNLPAGRQGYRLLAFWLMLAPLPAALSRDLVSGVRSLPLSIPLIIITAFGLSRLSHFRPLLILYVVFSIFFFIYYLDFYYVHQPYYSAAEWVTPYKPAFEVVKGNMTKYSHIVITDKLGQPYIFALFYLAINPADYQSQAGLVENSSGDVGKVEQFGQFEFRPVFWPQLRGLTNALFIGDEYELPEKDLNIPGLVHLADIYYPNGQPALRAVAIP